MMLFITIVASFFNLDGVTSTRARDNRVIDAHVFFISTGSVMAVGFSPCGPELDALSFDAAAQNFAYAGLTVPVVVGTASDEAVDASLEPPHDAMRIREAIRIPVVRARTISFPRICPTYCGDLNG